MSSSVGSQRDVNAPASQASDGKAFISAEGIARIYKKGANEVRVCTDLSFSVARGEFVALLGPSGSGKSTLLNLMAGFDRPTSGALRVGDATISTMSDSQLTEWRAQNLGFVFQHHNLISLLTAMENVAFPLRKMGMSKAERTQRATNALTLVGLAARKDHYPTELSGGEEQRVAIARAIITDPPLLLADEPTGNLDAVSAKQVMDILDLLNREHGKTIILVTHDAKAASVAGRRLTLEKGVLSNDTGAAPKPPTPPSSSRLVAT